METGDTASYSWLKNISLIIAILGCICIWWGVWQLSISKLTIQRLTWYKHALHFGNLYNMLNKDVSVKP